MKALQHNFLLRGYFKKKAKADAKKAEKLQEEIDNKLKNDKRIAEDTKIKANALNVKDSLYN